MKTATSQTQAQTVSEIMMSQFIEFGKVQISAFLGGITDFAIMIMLTEWFGIHFTISIIVGGLIGAIVNFLINRFWTFREIDEHILRQLIKFVLMALGSIVLKVIGTYILTNYLNVDYRISRLLTDAFVCFGFNYLLQKFWVFKHQ